MARHTRRAVTAGAVSVLVGGLAGCSSPGGDEETEDESEETEGGGAYG